MKLYLRMLRFLQPHVKLLALSGLLSLFFIFFNSASLWLMATFVQALFVQPAGSGPGAAGLVQRTLSDSSLNTRIKEYIAGLITQDSPSDTLKMVCFILFGCLLLKNLVDYANGLLIGLLELRVVNDIRNRIYEHLHRLPMKFFDSNRSGELTSISINDVGYINAMLRSSFEKLLLTPLELLSFLTMLIIISWKLTLYSLIVVPVISILVIQIGASIRRKSRRIFAQIAGVINLLQEVTGAMRIVKAFAMEEYEIKRFHQENDKFLRLSFRQRQLNALSSPLNEVLGASVVIFLLWYGGTQVLAGKGLSPEDFVRFIILLLSMFAPLKTLSGLNNTIQAGMAAGERVIGLLDTEAEIVDKPNAVALTGFHRRLELCEVSFRYAPDAPLVLKHIKLEINKGAVVAFVGHSGAGKSTLVDLVPRFYEVSSGAVRIDGHDIRDVKLNSLRRLMGIVTQESILFNDTVRANIGYGLTGVKDGEIIDAAKVANAWEFIERMEQGLDTVIGERGVKLSGGQRQRLSIARAVLKNPPILILDEATSALDSESEKLVQEAINALMEHRTVLVIAHRLSTIVHADKIVVLKDGEILETGRHEELMRRNGYYRHLYKIQFDSAARGAAQVQDEEAFAKS